MNEDGPWFKIQPPWVAISWIDAARAQPLRFVLLGLREPATGLLKLVESRHCSTGIAYFGASLDGADRILDLFDVWIQSPQELATSPATRCGLVSNTALDLHWQRHLGALRELSSDQIIFSSDPAQPTEPWVIDPESATVTRLTGSGQRTVTLCRDDAQLMAAERVPYGSSLERWFTSVSATGETVWISLAQLASGDLSGAPVALPSGAAKRFLPFNLSGGPILICRSLPLSLDNAADWLRFGSPAPRTPIASVGEIAHPAFVLEEKSLLRLGQEIERQGVDPQERDGLEGFFLRLSLWSLAVREAQRRSRQLGHPFFNLSSDAFRVALCPASITSPLFLSARVELVRPSEALLFEPAPGKKWFVPLGPPAATHGVGRLGGWLREEATVRFSQVTENADGTVRLEGLLDGKLLREASAVSLIWIKLTIEKTEVTFLAQLESEQSSTRAGRRFKASAVLLAAERLAVLKSSAIPRRPCEVSILQPIGAAFDIHLLGSLGVRLLLASDPTSVPELEDDLFELAALLPQAAGIEEVKTVLAIPDLNPRLRRLLAPAEWNPGARSDRIPSELWFATIREILLFLAVEETDPANTEATADWLAPLNARLASLEQLVVHTRGLLWAPREAEEEISRIVHRFVGEVI